MNETTNFSSSRKMTLVVPLQHVASAWQTVSTFAGKFLLLWIAMSAPLCAVQMMIIVAVLSIPFVFKPSHLHQHHSQSPKTNKFDNCNNKKPLSRRSLSLIIFTCLIFVILPTIFISFGHLLIVCAVHKIAPHFESLYFYALPTSFLSSHVGGVEAYVHKSISTRIRSTRHGVLRGLLYQFSNENWGQLNATDVEVYLGIRYAAAPIGDFRFMPPSSSPSWTGVMNATEFGPACPQLVPNSRHLRQNGMPQARLEQIERLTPFLQNQSEDCLFLNIYTPVLSHNDLSPVVIFIHGESYEWNSGNAYDGSVLASYAQVVVITFNFRLGVLGYLSTGDSASRGNYALMDMLAAITWVRDNINVFGGDPSRMSLMGHDSGAASASLLMSLPQTLSSTAASSSSSSSLSTVGNEAAQQTLSMQKRAASSSGQQKAPLFQRVILISGSALEPSAMSYNPVIYAKIIAEQFSCPTNVMRELVNCLQGLSVEDILQAQSTIRVPRFLTAFGPVVDGYFITKPPVPLSFRDQQDHSNCRFGLLFGLTPTAGLKYLTDEDVQRSRIDSQRQQRITRTLVRNLFTYHMEEIYQAINFEYASVSVVGSGGRSLNSADSIRHEQVREQTVNMLGDALSAAPLVKTASVHSSRCESQHHSNHPQTYFYVFNHRSQPERVEENSANIQLLAEAAKNNGEILDFQDELSYIFGAPLLKNSLLSPFARHSYSERDAVVSQAMMTYFGNFLATGDPTKSSLLANRSPQRLSPPSASPAAGRGHIHRRFIENVSWPPFIINTSVSPTGTATSQYSTADGAYLSISLEPAVRSQYRSHYMSFWNDLVPQLNNADDTNAFAALSDNNNSPTTSSLLASFNQNHNTAHSQHHLLPNFEDMSTYEGTVLPAAHILTAAQVQFNTRSTSAGNNIKRTAGLLHNGESSMLDSGDLPVGDSPMNRSSQATENDGIFPPGETMNKIRGMPSSSGNVTSARSGSPQISPSYAMYGAAAVAAIAVLCFAVCIFVCLWRKCCGKKPKNSSSNDRAITAFNSTPDNATKQQYQKPNGMANGKKSASLQNHYKNAAHMQLLPDDGGEPHGITLDASMGNGRLPNSTSNFRGNATLPNSATVRNQMTIAAPSLTLDWANNHGAHQNRASVYVTQNGTLPNNSNELKYSLSLPGVHQQKYWPAAANYLLNPENAPPHPASSDNNNNSLPFDPQQHYQQQQGLVGARIAASASTVPLCFPPLQASRSHQLHHHYDFQADVDQHYQRPKSVHQTSVVQNVHYGSNHYPTTIATVAHLPSTLPLSNGDEHWSANQSARMNGSQFAPPQTNQGNHKLNGMVPRAKPDEHFHPPPPLNLHMNKDAEVPNPAGANNSFQETDFNAASQQQRESAAVGKQHQKVHFSNNDKGRRPHQYQQQHGNVKNSTQKDFRSQSNVQQTLPSATVLVPNGDQRLVAAPAADRNNVEDTDETAV